jgi:hypothetical protein
MISAGRPRFSDWRAVLFSQVLALAFLAGSLWWISHELSWVFASHRDLVSFDFHDPLGSPLFRQLAAFAGAAWAVHALLGLLALALAALTERAFPKGVAARPMWLIAGWFVLLVGLAMTANTTWFSSSVFASDESWWRGRLMGVHPVLIVATLIALVVAGLAVRALPRLWSPRPAATIAVVAALVVLAIVLSTPRLVGASTPAAVSTPHIVIIGIDSLRNDLKLPRRGEATTPNIRDFLAGARRFNDATTPLARTYPSWLSILTGRHPVTTNARVNLMPRGQVHEGETLAAALRHHGYRAIYATDEVRFANFDRSFGFDEVITPPVGASDFILGYVGDMPLINLVASTSAGGMIFPSNYANRAAFVTYRPGQFLHRLEHELRIEGPTFLALHLTLAHWPYAWAGMRVPRRPEQYRDAYGAAVAEVDRQFEAVIHILTAAHVLDDAIVVLLSDHGEALGADDDSMLRKIGTGDEIWNSLWGHGTSVMSPNQYRVLLAMRAFGRARLPGPKRDYDWPVSLEDLRPTLEQYATGKSPANVDGISLLPYLADPGLATQLAGRVRFTETDFNTADTLAGRYQESGIIAEAAAFYELDPKSGWVQFRENRLPELLAHKQRAALSSHTLLAAIPGSPGQGTRYLLTSRDKPDPRVLEGPPDASRDPEARRLWDALQARFPGELPAESDLPRM